MPTLNNRRHIIPLGAEASFTRAVIFEQFGESIHDVVPVANVAARAQLVSDLIADEAGPSPANPLVVYRADAPGLHRLESTTDGTVWVPASGVLRFGDLAAAQSWATANPSLLTLGDRCYVGGVEHAWTGAWSPRASAWTVVPAADPTWSTAGAYGYRGLSVRASGEMIRLEGVISRTSGTIADGFVGGVIPAGFRPSTRVWVPSGFSPLTASARVIEVVVETNGDVKFSLAGQPDIPAAQIINLAGGWFL